MQCNQCQSQTKSNANLKVKKPHVHQLKNTKRKPLQLCPLRLCPFQANRVSLQMVLVTGGTGLVGVAFITSLIQNGENVRLLRNRKKTFKNKIRFELYKKGNLF